MHLNQFFLEWSTFLAVIDLQDIIETDLLLRLQYCLIWKITKPPLLMILVLSQFLPGLKASEPDVPELGFLNLDY